MKRPALACIAAMLVAAAPAPGPTVAEVVDAAPADAWQAFDQSQLVYMTLADGGRVVIALAPQFAPAMVANIKRLIAARWFDGLSINRVQDNYVVQWGDASEGKPLPRGALARLEPEWERATAGLALTPVPGGDGYAPAHAYADGGWPVALDPARARAWLVHCYAMVGVGRGDAPDSGSGGELYAVIGATPRNLDRNVTLVGRVIDGIERLSALPRGTLPLGFYAEPAQRVPIASVRLGSGLPPGERVNFEALRAGSASFAALVQARANRRESFFVTPAGHVDLCNVRAPVRRVERSPAGR